MRNETPPGPAFCLVKPGDRATKHRPSLLIVVVVVVVVIVVVVVVVVVGLEARRGLVVKGRLRRAVVLELHRLQHQQLLDRDAPHLPRMHT